jgi:hypothetical protein
MRLPAVEIAGLPWSVRYRTQKNICLASPFTLAIGHMSAYTCGITDLTLGVSG